MNPSDRPYIVLHMTASLDGKLQGKYWEQKDGDNLMNAYADWVTKNNYVYGLGSNTVYEMIKSPVVDLSKYKDAKVDYEDHIIKSEFPYMITFARSDKCRFDTKVLEFPAGVKYSPFMVIPKSITKEYVAHLNDMGISYMFAGDKEMDLPLAMKKIKSLWKVDKFAMVGGSIIAGAFWKDDWIDETSIFIFPYFEGNNKIKGFVDTGENFIPTKFRFDRAVGTCEGGVQLFFKKSME